MIPKVIHYCWFGGAPKPQSVKRCIASWKKYCPDYEIIEWNEGNIDISMNLYTKQAYEAKKWGFVPDYLRLWIIYHHGGIYLDTDVQLLKSFDPLLNEDGFAGFETDEYISFGLGFGAEAGHPLIKMQMEVYDNLRFINKDGSLNCTPSPTYITRIMQDIGFLPNNGTIQRIHGFACFPPEFFCPKDFYTGLLNITNKTYSIHQFDASWFDENAQAQKINRWKKIKKEAMWDRFIHTPNRFTRWLLGKENYEKLKELLKRR